MEIIELPIKGNFLEIPDRCETDRLETEMVGDNHTHTPAQTIESGVEMEGDNEPVNMKRGQNETEKDNVIEKWRKREGIKRNLRELSRKSYEECEDDCDELDQSKKYKHGINCLLAALNHDGSRPLRKTELQPISGLAVSGGTVPSATNRAGAGIQGGEKAKGGSSNAQSVRNHRRGNNPTKYLWKTLILVLYLLGSVLGGESRIERGQAIIPIGVVIIQDLEQGYQNKHWRTRVMMNPETYLFSTPSLFRNQPDGKTDMEIKGCYRVSGAKEEG